MGNLEGKLPHCEIKLQVKQNDVSAYANYVKSTIQMQSHLSALGKQWVLWGVTLRE